MTDKKEHKEITHTVDHCCLQCGQMLVPKSEIRTVLDDLYEQFMPEEEGARDEFTHRFKNIKRRLLGDI